MIAVRFDLVSVMFIFLFAYSVASASLYSETLPVRTRNKSVVCFCNLA